MEIALQTIGSFAAAAFAWVALEFVGRPLRKFFDLRGEIIRRLIEINNVRARWKEIAGRDGEFEHLPVDPPLSDAEIQRLEKAKEMLRDLAAQMHAFAGNESFALLVAKWLRYNPFLASTGLIGLSNTRDTYGPDRAKHMQTIRTALKCPPGLF